MSAEYESTQAIREQFVRTDKGEVKQTIQNCMLVFENDPTLKGCIRYNAMTDRTDIVKDLGWARDGTMFTDTDFAHILLFMEKMYGLTSDNKIRTAVKVTANMNRYHPVQDYLNGLVWDGIPRIKYALNHFLGADLNDYTEEAMRVFMLGLISRVFKPGTKFDYMLCLVGGQGAGKSTFFRFLACKDEWFSDDLKKLDDENVYRKMQGHTVIELSEMIATASARSIEDIKSFISRQSDVYKVPYETQPKDRPRQCVFGGSSNAMDTLPLDRSGNRRFLPVMVYPDKAECHILENEQESRAYIEQMWAEAMNIYRSKEYRLTISDEVSAYLVEYQKQFMPEDTEAGMIIAFLESYKGDKVCSKLLWSEALRRDYDPKPFQLKMICDIMNNSVIGWKSVDKVMHFSVYGKQRGWVRDEVTKGMPDKVTQLSFQTDDNGFTHISDEDEIPFK